jgi:superfamily II DNA or RNA helicase
MSYELRPYQTDLLDRINNTWFSGTRSILAQLPTGGGKCLGINTPILMFDGSIKLVQDIVVGDCLMGDDSTPRTVLTLARGRETMYRITPVKGDIWECNESHILSLLWNGDESLHRKRGDIIDISVKDYLNLNATQKHCLKQYRVGVEYRSKPIKLDPYYLGVWLGDGSKRRPMISNIDSELVDYVNKYALSLGLTVRSEPDSRSKCVNHCHEGVRGKVNPITAMLRGLNVLENKHIPNDYLVNDRSVRLSLLAGLLDTDGYLHHGYFEIVQKVKALADDIVNLSRGLGFAAYVSIKNVNGVSYYRITISGDVSEIPCKVARRIASERLQKKSVLRTGFSIQSIGVGDYYGFEIDGNRRFLLGDHTVTHNTILFSTVVHEANQNGLKCLVLAHREELIKQAAEKLEIITNDPVGIIKAGYPTNYDRDIQVASVQSLTRRLNHCPEFDLIVVDEAHHSTSKTYRTILDRFPGARVLGVTATPIRLDGKGFRGIFDELICGVTVSELITSGSLSPYKYFATERSMSVEGVGKRQGDFKSEDVARANPVAGLAGDVVKSYRDYLDGKQAVVFCVNVEHSIAIAAHFNAAGIIAHHLDGNSSPGERADVMQKFRDKYIQVLTNCALFDEGLDIPGLDGVILARPTASLSRYLQMVGRALRVAEGKEHATIIDLAGNWERLGMVDDERRWTLDGVEKKKRKATKLVRDKDTGEVKEVVIDLTPTGSKFVRITGQSFELTPELKFWIDRCDRLVAEQTIKEYKPSWCGYRLLSSEIKPPLEAWKYLGQKLGYQYGWAKHKVDEWDAAPIKLVIG